MNTSVRWQHMHDAIAQARQQPAAVIQAVSSTSSRDEAATALATLLGIGRDLTDQLLDLHLSDFVKRPG